MYDGGAGIRYCKYLSWVGSFVGEMMEAVGGEWGTSAGWRMVK
jgi:hypothetical protein